MIQNVHSYLMPTYGEREIEFIRGEGAYLFSSKNTKYLDFGSGIAVNSLGHCHPSLVKALRDQSSKLWHTSNLYLNKIAAGEISIVDGLNAAAEELYQLLTKAGKKTGKLPPL